VQDGHFHVDYLSHGYFRDSWLYRHQPSTNSDLDTHQHHPSSLSSSSFVLKTLRLFQTFDYDTTNLIENEAVIMERLTSSERIVDIYGHCGTSLAAEYMQDITLELVPGKSILAGDRGRMKQTDLDQMQMDDVHPMNNLTVAEKLDKALVMAESMADLHGFAGGAIVHGDVHPDQWLRSATGQIKLK
jgi:serine/threonine protein kinase